MKQMNNRTDYAPQLKDVGQSLSKVTEIIRQFRGRRVVSGLLTLLFLALYIVEFIYLIWQTDDTIMLLCITFTGFAAVIVLSKFVRSNAKIAVDEYHQRRDDLVDDITASLSQLSDQSLLAISGEFHLQLELIPLDEDVESNTPFQTITTAEQLKLPGIYQIRFLSPIGALTLAPIVAPGLALSTRTDLNRQIAKAIFDTAELALLS